MKLNINIVGLTHNDIEEDCLQYARTATGKQLKLVFEEQNACDSLAVKVYDGSLFLGYVAVQDLEDVHAIRQVSGRKVLRALCMGYGAKEDGTGIYLKARLKCRIPNELAAGAGQSSDSRQSSGAKFSSAEELEVSGGKIVTMSPTGSFYEMPEALKEAYQHIYNDEELEKWHYSGPLYSIDKLARVEDCSDMLEDALEDFTAQFIALSRYPTDCRGRVMVQEMQDEFQEQVSELKMLAEEAELQLDCFMNNHRFDYSREMTNLRKHIQTLLQLQKSDRFLSQRKTLLSDMGFITCSDFRNESARNFFIQTPIELLRKQTGTYDYSDRLDEIEQELEAFPYDMYRKFKADPVDFLREIYYKHLPRKQMKQLLSGIILMIMHGRVNDVKCWGKYNDLETLEEMKTLRLRHVPGGKEMNPKRARQMEVLEICVKEIALRRNPNTQELLIRKQSDWYPIFHLLTDWKIFTRKDLQPFCDFIARLYQFGSDAVSPCKKKDLEQAKPCNELLYESAQRWKTLKPDKIKIQNAKFYRYLDIIDAFQKSVQKHAFEMKVNVGEFFNEY